MAITKIVVQVYMDDMWQLDGEEQKGMIVEYACEGDMIIKTTKDQSSENTPE